MEKAAMEGETGEMNPLLKEKLFAPRNVFTPGHRIRMNIVPMFLMIFIPWGTFIAVTGNCAFYVQYMRPVLAGCVVLFAIFVWIGSVLLAINRRKYDPEPGWYVMFAISFGIAVFGGISIGRYIYDNYSFPYYQVKDLKIISDINPSMEHGQNVLDAGQFYFVQGSKLDPLRAWHFKQKDVYCVAPIIAPVSNGQWPVPNMTYPNVPLTQSYDFWAVGKDCCSVSSSDFRCGDWNNPMARGGIRNMDDSDRAFYRLAVEQAAALYGINAQSPVFFFWAADPVEVTNSWNQAGFNRYMIYVGYMFLLFCFITAMATAKFSFMGRAASVYGETIYDDPDWKKGGFRQRPSDLHVHHREV
jgi:hypothetical protein